MKVLVIGASGFVGGAVTRHLASQGHDVTGQVRTARELGAGITTVLGDLDERLPELSRRARRSDAVVFAAQAPPETEYTAVAALVDALAGTGKALLFTSGTGVLLQRTWGEAGVAALGEDDPFVPEPLAARRVDTERLVRDSARIGVRGIVLRPPMLWGPGDHGHLLQIYSSVGVTGAACYVGAGRNGYSHLHIDDAARLFAAALDRGPAGALYHGVGGDVTVRTLAEAVADDLGCATRSLTQDEAVKVWGEFGALIIGSHSLSRSTRAETELGWSPTRRDILDQVGEDRLRALASPPVGRSPQA